MLQHRLHYNSCLIMNGKVFVVTGGASGLGEGAAEVLLQEGACVAIIDVNALENGLDQYGDRLLSIKADVSWCRKSDSKMLVFARFPVKVKPKKP